eukprot:18804-Chlamydomonas_euryale.AAC.1
MCIASRPLRQDERCPATAGQSTPRAAAPANATFPMFLSQQGAATSVTFVSAIQTENKPSFNLVDSTRGATG